MTTPRKRLLWAEVAAVLLVSLGASAIWAVLRILDRYTRDESIGSQTASLNPAQSDREWLDFLYQLAGNLLALAPVLLVCVLAWRIRRPHLGALGVTFDRPGRDALSGVALVLIVGVPGLALYFAGRTLDLTVNVVPSPLDASWWAVPMLVLSAVKAGLTEEVIVIGYLFHRLRQLGWGPWTIIVSTALLRGTYHLYQGIPAFFGNVAMGILFGWLYRRTGRLLPLVIAHILIDAIVFIGYPWAYATFPALFTP